jgi:hypothetical protein
MRLKLLKSIRTVAEMLRAHNDIFVCSNVGHPRYHNVYIIEHVCNMLLCKAVLRVLSNIVRGAVPH